MRRFSRRISGESLRSGVPFKKASIPPLNSMVRIALVDRRSRTAPIASDSSETVCKFGRKRRLVLRFEWLTLLPTWTPLPVTGHLRDMPHLACAQINSLAPPAGRRGSAVSMPLMRSGQGKHQGPRHIAWCALRDAPCGAPQDDGGLSEA